MILFAIVSFSSLLKAQICFDTIDSKKHFYTFKDDTYNPKTYYIGSHGYYFTSIEIIPMQTDFFKKLFLNDSLPTLNLNAGFTLAYLSFMRNWMFTSISHSHAPSEKKENDSLISKLTQSSTAVRFGYNLIKKPKVVVSTYVGLRYTRFRHRTNLKEKRISLDNYLIVRDIDLRVSQFSSAIGINTSFSIIDIWSIGLYASYLIDLHTNPIIRTKGNRITNKTKNIMDNFVIGIGFGFGFNEFYK